MNPNFNAMKKMLLSLAILVVAGSAAAQEYPKNIFGIRAGMNVSRLTLKVENLSESFDSRVSFHAGISDQIRLVPNLPLYLETGIYVTQKGGFYEGIKANPLYLQIPLLVNYHIAIGERLSIDPFAGIYYAVGVAGNLKYMGEKADYFGEYGLADRSDFGIRVGAGLSFGHGYLGLGYDFGLLNTCRDAYYKLHTGCFTLTLGYNF